MTEQEFIDELKKLNVIIDNEKLIKLNEYYNLLLEWNSKINLTRIIEKKDVYLKHFYDSLTLTKAVDLTKNIKICDVGSGAGFPGIVLKIIYPNLNITLVDSLNKRVNFLNEVINKLKLENIEAVHYRMEEYSKIKEEEYDIITSRAVAKLNVLIEISVKALKINGHLIFLKGNIENEVKESKNILKETNCKIKEIFQFKLPIENSTRNIIDIEKKLKTPNKYPRNINIIKK